MSIAAAYRNVGLYASDDFASTPAAVDFHHAALIALQRFKTAIESASKVSEDFIPKARAQKQAAIIRSASADLRKAVDEAAAPLHAPIVSLRAELEKAARGPAASADPNSALLRHLQVAELRRQIENVPENVRTLKLMPLAAAGNPYLIEALDGSLVPLVGQPIMDTLRESYLEAVAAPVLKRMEAAEEAESEALVIARQLDRWVARSAQEMGLESALDAPAPQLPEVWDNASKSAFIRLHGLNAFRNLIEGGIVPEWPKDNALSRHPVALTMSELIYQVGDAQAAKTWLLEKRLPEGWNPPTE